MMPGIRFGRQACCTQQSNVYGHSTVNVWHMTHPRERLLSPQAQSASLSSPPGSSRQAIKTELLRQIRSLGVQALIPDGMSESKRRIDELVSQLKHGPESNKPVESEGVLQSAAMATTSTQQLCGTWELVYASQGTALTRSSLAQAMLLLSSQLPGVGIQHIQQQLKTDPAHAGSITATNAAAFSLGLLGSWQVAIEGRWHTSRNENRVKVVFEKFKLRPTSYLGLDLPEWLPQVVVNLGEADEDRVGAEWLTSYLDDDLRLGEGPNCNIFVFTRAPQK